MLTTAAILLALVVLDRLSKVLAVALLTVGETVPVIPGLVGFYLLDGGNTGAAFGILQGKTLLLTVLTFLMLGAMLYVLLFKRFTNKWVKWSVLLIAAGGFGNLYDRIVYGTVTDFLRFLFWPTFPIFNVADCFVVVGAAVLLVVVLCMKEDAPIFLCEEKTDEHDA